MNSVKTVVSVISSKSFTKILIRQKSVYTRFSEVLTNNMTLVKSSSEQQNDQNEKPIVIMYGWLMAKNKYLNRYSDVYLDRGFDVLQVKISPRQVLWPLSVMPTVDSVIDYITNHPKKSVLVHGFSVGGFIHTEVMYKMFKSDEDIHAKAIKLVKGQIFDSVVDIIGIEEGISTALFFGNPTLRKLTKAMINGYLKATEESVGSIYKRDSKFFHSNPLKIPSLMLYSKRDHIGSSGPIEKAIDQWRKNGVLVDAKHWGDSSHVSHFKSYPDEYIKMIDNFLSKIGLLTNPAMSEIEESDVASKSSFSMPPPISLPTSLRRPVSEVDGESLEKPSISIISESNLNDSNLKDSLRKEKSRIAVKNI